MYRIIIADKAKQQLKKLEKTIQTRILKSLERIRIRPRSYLVKLVNDRGFKYRIGDYRVIVDVYDEDLVVLVIKIGHRRNIYK